MGQVWSDPENGPWRQATHWASPYNWQAPSASAPKVEIYDTTLRDGEQAAGATFSPERKVEIAEAMDALGVHIIEAGFPAVSSADFEGVKAVAALGLKAKVVCLARAREEDIELAASAGVSGVTIEVPVGYPRLKYQFNWSADDVAAKAVNAVERAAEAGLEASLFMIDSTRAELSVLESVIRACVETGALARLVVVDTVGVATPSAMGFLVSECRRWFTTGAIEVHAHNDFGLGVANALASVAGGASCIQTTVNGLGQRAGNAPLEEVVMALECLLNVRTGIDLTKLASISHLVAEASGYAVGDNKAVVGKSVYSWEPGLPIDALRKNPLTVLPFDPAMVGRESELVLGKMSGAASIDWALEKLGAAHLDDDVRKRLLAQVKQKGIELQGPVPLEYLSELVTAESR